jgi:chaperonin GroEL (HSP60 family)
MDALDVVMELRSHDDKRRGLYINGSTRGLFDMTEVGIIEPLALVEQVINSAIEVTIAILRIDDIMGRRSE